MAAGVALHLLGDISFHRRAGSIRQECVRSQFVGSHKMTGHDFEEPSRITFAGGEGAGSRLSVGSRRRQGLDDDDLWHPQTLTWQIVAARWHSTPHSHGQHRLPEP